MIRLAILLLTFILVSWKDPLCRKNHDYMPLSVGNTWSYDDVSLKENEIISHTWKVVGDTAFKDTIYYILKYDNLPAFRNKVFLRNNSHALYEKSDGTSPPILKIPPVDWLGKTYLVIRDSVSFHITLLSADTVLTTPKSKYKSLLCLRQQDLDKAETRYYYFKKGVGLIGVTDEKGNVVRYLTSYDVR